MARDVPPPTLPSQIPDQTIDDLIERIEPYALAVIGIGAFLGILYSGYLMISSQGDVAQFTKGKNGLIWSVIGIIVITLSYFILRATSDFAKGL